MEYSPSTTPANLPWSVRGTCSCSSGAVGPSRPRLRVHRLLQVACQAEGVCGIARLEHFASPPTRNCWLRSVGATWLARIRRSSIQVMACSSGYWLTSASARATNSCGIHLLVGDVARQAHQLLLAFQQAQAHPLLGVFHVALDRFLFAFDLLQPQVPEGRHDGGQKQQHRRQRRQHGKAVLAVAIGCATTAPPRPRRNRLREAVWRWGRMAHEVQCRGSGRRTLKGRLSHVFCIKIIII
jgi:hypothetical protein